MRFYLKNNPAKFHLEPIWNDTAIGFFWRACPNKNKNKNNKKKNNEMSCDWGISSWSTGISSWSKETLPLDL